MTKGKWGESFLKSGLPLEHLTLVTFKTLGWFCSSHMEYARPNREKEETWFELDMEATSEGDNNGTELAFLVECKYHDLSRFWFFLPHEPDRWAFNDRVFNCGPLSTLTEPTSKSALELAPTSNWGITVSEDGTKQENAVYAAVQQLVNAFVPYSLMRKFTYNLDPQTEDEEEIESFLPLVTATVPMIVTNATIFRLKPDITDLERIREASAPHEIAEEVEWTWYYFDPPMTLFDQNLAAINSHMEKEPQFLYRFPQVTKRLDNFDNRPNWIAIANIKYLTKTINVISEHYFSLPVRSPHEILNRPKPEAAAPTRPAQSQTSAGPVESGR